eukprot:CAMPEP_0201724658 /NCGR_PEP_ID=MMETSP0593-20130828/8345_1 /ASSEMBLY_ACC=CAM_ASM_000672 /TAXON_ID=267983 /ORGANISM="Skeletonema japonicum, Strain CCMP2506" /LENGTH=1117 /DNA_ID=CAMNT_0048215959 /DNA_START=28 /DNA_END=3381 /DNA_ORIENTATION=+
MSYADSNMYADAPQEAYQPQGQNNSMTIDEMRILHRTALVEAESKRTELRLVLASRYRELVGSSDEVISMKERAEELNALVVALPELIERVVQSADASDAGGSADTLNPGESPSKIEGKDEDESSLVAVRSELSRLPREIHRCLDDKNVHGAAAALISLFEVISSRSKSYPLANLLSGSKEIPDNITNSPLLETQMRMVYLHVQTLPARVEKLARRVLLQSAAKHGGARGTAAALSALDLLDVSQNNAAPSSGPSQYASRSTKLIDLYYESKAQLLNNLLNRLTLPTSVSAADATSVANAAEFILSKIVLILQYDVILHPYQIFVQRNFPVTNANENDVNGDMMTKNKKIVDDIMSSMPRFDSDMLKSKASRFLAAHLPLIRTKVKSVLMIIAGTTASKLGQIRQSLYDKTDGIECMNALDSSGVCTWDEAVSGMVDIRVVSHGTSFAPAAGTGKTSISDDQGVAASNGHSGQQLGSSRRFSLWGALFSNTFSSLVHSLLTTSFHSVHARVVSTLRTSLARAPPFEYMLPHEAHRNALRIATDLDASLRKVSDDAHELLVHAEEREESERRLRQSLYVQTCEIMGRLLNELRRMLLVKQKEEDAIKELIVGRLCHLLKFRLASLPNLLDPKSSPAVLTGLGGGKSTGMISLMELSSSFDLADDDDDGLISIEEAMEAMESAFSGTHFHGAEMVRDTLLLSTSQSGAGDTTNGVTNRTNGSFAQNKQSSAPQNVTLSELALLSAKGLRHDATGPQSALGTVQSSLDEIVSRCFKGWAKAALSPPLKSFRTKLQETIEVSSAASDIEWRRMNGLIEKDDDDLLKEIHDPATVNEELTKRQKTAVGHLSPHFLSYLLAVAAVLNRSICPADSLPPVPSLDYAKALGMCFSDEEEAVNMLVTIRGSLLGEAVLSMSQSLQEEVYGMHGGADKSEILEQCSPSSLIQLLMDVKFVNRCFFERNQNGFLSTSDFIDDSRGIMTQLSQRLSDSVNAAVDDGLSIDRAISERHSQVFVSCGLFLSSIFGEDGNDKISPLNDSVSNGFGGSSLLLSSSLVTNPLASSRRFTLLPIQAEKSLTELQLRGRYGKKVREEKESNKDVSSGNALGSGFGFLSSMLSTKTR